MANGDISWPRPIYIPVGDSNGKMASMEAHPSAQPMPPLVDGVSIYLTRVSPWLTNLTLCCHRLRLVWYRETH